MTFLLYFMEMTMEEQIMRKAKNTVKSQVWNAKSSW